MTLAPSLDKPSCFVGQPILAAAGLQPAFSWLSSLALRRFLPQETLPKGSSPARVNAFFPRSAPSAMPLTSSAFIVGRTQSPPAAMSE
jgi:hypothetical protein